MAESPYARMTREELAEIEVGNTAISRPTSLAMVAGFILTIVGVPLAQHAIEIQAGFLKSGSWVWPKAYQIFDPPRRAWLELVDPENGSLLGRLQAANGQLIRGLKSYEEALEDDSFIAVSALPHAQALTAEFLGLGNEQVYLGRNGWLFYEPDVTYLTGPGFLSPSWQRSRLRGTEESGGTIQPDPRKAIIEFRDQLQARGIRLIIMPVPVKPMIEPEFLSRAYDQLSPLPLQNPSYGSFLESLDRAGIEYVDVSKSLLETKRLTRRPQFLRTDTHWTPNAMEKSVALLAEKIRMLDPLKADPGFMLRRSTQTIEGTGDIVSMLKLPSTSPLYPKETTTIRPVSQENGAPWVSDQHADILVLGDSFFNIFSLAEMGWGASAGFVEQLSYTLGRPLDAILRNDAGAFATRELLGQELARGRDRLDGKRLVIWEFAVRELATGNWDFVPMKVPARAPRDFLALESGERNIVQATIKSFGSIPRPGTTPYKDFLTAFHIVAIGGDPAKEAVVYLQTMKDQELTSAARLRPGDAVSLELTSWTDAEPRFGAINRSELNDENLLLEEPNFAELSP
jgi:SGNH hydrolase-like domain, acetyltransferase AlgX